VQCCSSVRSRRLLLVLTALLFGVTDVMHKLLDPAHVHHARTPIVAMIIAALITGLVLLVPRIPSNAAAIGAGIACGGALGNLVSLLWWADGVPDPFIVAGTERALAFNLADLFALAGDALLVSAAVVYGVRHRDQLRRPI
jgi:lipoprotein signal peptidase